MLCALAQYGEDGCTREQLTVLTGYKRSTRDLHLQRLQQRGAVTARGDALLATPGGIAALGDRYEPLPTGDALRDYWLQRLPAGERALLQALVNAYPDAVDCDELSTATNYKRSTRDLYLQKLSSRRLVTRNRGECRASSSLFAEGAAS